MEASSILFRLQCAPLTIERKKNINRLLFPIKFTIIHTYMLFIMLPKCMTLSIYLLTNFSLCGINQVVLTYSKNMYYEQLC